MLSIGGLETGAVPFFECGRVGNPLHLRARYNPKRSCSPAHLILIMSDTGEVTRLLGEIGSGKKDAMNQLLPLVYDELHRLARSYFRRERGEHTLQPTALVHEAYILGVASPNRSKKLR
jgi:hypothetical protein